MSAGGRQRARGFTLTEVLLVVALMAILSMMVVSGSGMLSGTRLRSAAGRRTACRISPSAC